MYHLYALWSYHILLLVAVSVESEGAHALRLLLRIHLVDGDEELVRDGLAHQAPHVVGLEIELQFKRMIVCLQSDLDTSGFLLL